MREILLRGKLCGTAKEFHKTENNNSDWVIGWYCPTPFGRWTLTPAIVQAENAIRGSHVAWEIDPETVGQYTGLKDKNGEKIFEGDIVVCNQPIQGNWVDSHTVIGYVEMKHGAFGLHRKLKTSYAKIDAYYRPFKDWLEDYEYEVIGNIYDNPELLEV